MKRVSYGAPPPKKKKDKNGVLIEEAADATVPMSQQYELPDDAVFASLPSPPAAARPSPPTGKLDCVELEIDWKEDGEATQLPINGPYTRRSWSMRDALGNVYSEGSENTIRSPMIN